MENTIRLFVCRTARYNRVMKSIHPRPAQNRFIQYGAIAVFVVMLLAAALQIVLALAIRPGGLFFLTAVITLLLSPFVLLLTTATPGVTVTPEGITIEPVIWRHCFVPWADVAEVRPYPLLPQAGAETTRRALAGRSKYAAAAGIMLVIPVLPVQYRIVGVLAGVGGQPAIAVTNRTHTGYEQLVALIETYSQGQT